MSVLEDTGHATLSEATEDDKRRIVPLQSLVLDNEKLMFVMKRDYDLEVPGTEQLVDGNNNPQAAPPRLN